MMKIARHLACGAELFLFGIVIWSYRFGNLVGIVATILWLLFGFGIMALVGWDIDSSGDDNPPQQADEEKKANKRIDDTAV